MEKDTPLGYIGLKNKFQSIGNSELREVTNASIDHIANICNVILDNEKIDNLEKKSGNLVSLEEIMINNDTPTGNPYYLVGYIKIGEHLKIVDSLKKFNTSILETIYGYRVEMGVIGESHTIEIYDNDGNIVASEIVACLPLDDEESMYELKDNKNIRIKKDGYDHKIMTFNNDKLGKKLGTTYHHGKDMFYNIQQDILSLGEPQCSYEFPFEIEIEHNGKNHKVQTAGITALKVFSIENNGYKKIVVYTMHGYKQKGGLVTWDAPIDDTIIITRSIFDINILGK
ncbi:MAG: hypothetical protein PHS49_07515 [Candidatus Gracilibacteria bacterium]|nr:hypothetical protein [Candidatus Gracilibacteria bacterium]